MITKDTVVITSSGQYSDYGLIGLYKASKDFDVKEELIEYEKQHPQEKPKYTWIKKEKCWDSPKFFSFLKDRGCLESIKGFEIWESNYSYEMTPEDYRVVDLN